MIFFQLIFCKCKFFFNSCCFKWIISNSLHLCKHIFYWCNNKVISVLGEEDGSNYKKENDKACSDNS